MTDAAKRTTLRQRGSAPKPDTAAVATQATATRRRALGPSVAQGGNYRAFNVHLGPVLSLSYRLCQTASSANCATANAQITIPALAIVAAADTFNLAVGNSGGRQRHLGLRRARLKAARLIALAAPGGRDARMIRRTGRLGPRFFPLKSGGRLPKELPADRYSPDHQPGAVLPGPCRKSRHEQAENVDASSWQSRRADGHSQGRPG